MTALNSSRDDIVTDVLVARADDVDPKVRYGVAWSLERRPASEARTALERLATDEDADVRDAAHEVLELSS